ncbi:MAG: energy-coupled thiamine transporter ThiT [Clostridia bacterium]|nr:energy-coupled thiamine transporter ThiT [Clostridia bacterium]
MFLSSIVLFISEGAGLYISLGMIVLALVLALVLSSKNAKKVFLYLSAILTLVWFLAVSIDNISAYFSQPSEDREFDYSMWAMLIVFVVILLSSITAILLNKSRRLTPILSTALIALPIVAIVISFLLIPLGYEDQLMTDSDKVFIVLTTIVIVLCLLFATKLDKPTSHTHTQSIVYASICIALSFALSYTTLWQMPQGGRVTIASLLPLMLYSYIFGVRRGISAGFIYGLLQFIQNPYFVSPWQFLLDYSLAFACIGLAGAFRGLNIHSSIKFSIGAIVAGVFRYLCHVFSGVFAFGMYAPVELGAWGYSLGYNAYVFIDLIIVIVVGAIALSSKQLINAFPRESQK